MSSFVTVRAVRSAINNNYNLPRRTCQLSTSSSLHNSNKKSSSAGSSSSKPDLTKSVQDPPSFVFKKTDGGYEKELSKFASKSGDYQNPEYFLYHRLTYTDMDVVMQKYRLPQPTNAK